MTDTQARLTAYALAGFLLMAILSLAIGWRGGMALIPAYAVAFGGWREVRRFNRG